MPVIWLLEKKSDSSEKSFSDFFGWVIKKPRDGALNDSSEMPGLGVFLLAAACLAFAFSRTARLFFFCLLRFGRFFFLFLFITNTGIAYY